MDSWKKIADFWQGFPDRSSRISKYNLMRLYFNVRPWLPMRTFALLFSSATKFLLHNTSYL